MQELQSADPARSPVTGLLRRLEHDAELVHGAGGDLLDGRTLSRAEGASRAELRLARIAHVEVEDLAAVRKVIETLKREFPGKGAVELDRAEDVLLATVLSARTRDEQVLKVYPKLRKRFPTLASLASASAPQIAVPSSASISASAKTL